jgi:hypothetical protein
MSGDKIVSLIILVVGMLLAFGFGIYNIVFPSYSYQGVTEMTQESYANFMNEYGFKDKEKSNFATAYNQQTDKLIITYDFESREKISQYGISNSKPIYNASIVSFIASVIFLMLIFHEMHDLISNLKLQ